MTSSRTKACAVLPSVREAVLERDGNVCAYCCATNWLEIAHFIRRSQGGLGIEQNLVTLCVSCHDNYDESPMRRKMGEWVKDYLDTHYPDFDDARRYYRKGIEND